MANDDNPMPVDPDDLKTRAARGGAWTAIGTGYVTVAQLGTYLVLYRFLAKAEFGLMEMVTTVAALAVVLADAGVSNALVWRQDLSRDQLSSLYWLNVGCAAGVGLIVAATSPLVALGYGEPELTGLLCVFAVTFLIAGAGQQFTMLLRRDLRFRALAGLNALSVTIGCVAGVAFAASGAGVWSLVFWAIAREFARLAGLFALVPRRWLPRLHFAWSDTAPVIRFSLLQLGSRCVAAVRNQFDSMIVGAFIGASTLGVYGQVKRWVLQPLAKLNPIVSTVAFPSLARVQDDDALLRRGYVKVIRYVSAMAAPVLAVLFAAAPAFVPVVFGEAFADHADLMVVLTRILCLLGLGRALANPVGSLILAKGRAGVSFVVSLAMTAVSLTALAVGIHWGAVGVAWAQVATVAVLVGVGLGVAVRLVRLRLLDWLGAVSVSVGLAAIAGVAAWAVGLCLDSLAPLWRLLTQLATGATAYIVLIALLARSLLTDSWTTLRGRRPSQPDAR